MAKAFNGVSVILLVVLVFILLSRANDASTYEAASYHVQRAIVVGLFLVCNVLFTVRLWFPAQCSCNPAADDEDEPDLLTEYYTGRPPKNVSYEVLTMPTFALPTHREFLRTNRLLPSDLQQRAVLIGFAEPIPSEFTGEFYRIQLTRQMFDGGEEEFYQAEIFQPQRVGQQACPLCQCMMQPVARGRWKCISKTCKQPDGRPTHELEYVCEPARGVISVMTFPDFVAHTEEVQIPAGITWATGKPVQTYRTVKAEYLNRALLVLDRRYHPSVLAAVKRTAGEICDMYGWALSDGPIQTAGQ